jgi:hypothetical protein
VKLTVPTGGSFQARAGEISAPPHVYLAGIAPLFSKAELVNVNDPRLVVGASDGALVSVKATVAVGMTVGGSGVTVKSNVGIIVAGTQLHKTKAKMVKTSIFLNMFLPPY